MVICGFSRANSWDSRNQSPKTTPAKKKKKSKDQNSGNELMEGNHTADRTRSNTKISRQRGTGSQIGNPGYRSGKRT